MKFVACPKGGRIPEGYCRQSCLNYSGEREKEKSGALTGFLITKTPQLNIPARGGIQQGRRNKEIHHGDTEGSEISEISNLIK